MRHVTRVARTSVLISAPTFACDFSPGGAFVPMELGDEFKSSFPEWTVFMAFVTKFEIVVDWRSVILWVLICVNKFCDVRFECDDVEETVIVIFDALDNAGFGVDGWCGVVLDDVVLEDVTDFDVKSGEMPFVVVDLHSGWYFEYHSDKATSCASSQ